MVAAAHRVGEQRLGLRQVGLHGRDASLEDRDLAGGRALEASESGQRALQRALAAALAGDLVAQRVRAVAAGRGPGVECQRGRKQREQHEGDGAVTDHRAAEPSQRAPGGEGLHRLMRRLDGRD